MSSSRSVKNVDRESDAGPEPRPVHLTELNSNSARSVVASNVTRKLIAAHLVDGTMDAGHELGIRIDHTLTDASTGMLVMLELEAMGLERVHTQLSVHYSSPGDAERGEENADEQTFLASACQRFGIWRDEAPVGGSHLAHQEKFGKPGRTLLGSHAHACAAGAIGMLAISADGLETALAMAGEPFQLQMPEIWGVKLSGALPASVGAAAVVTELHRRHGGRHGAGRSLEYYGPGLDDLSVTDRHLIASLGSTLGVVASVFPSDRSVREFMRAHGRQAEWTEIVADPGATYDHHEAIDLSALSPVDAPVTSRASKAPPASLGAPPAISPAMRPTSRPPASVTTRSEESSPATRQSPRLRLESSSRAELVLGKNIVTLPWFQALSAELRLPVMAKMGDNISTAEILSNGAHILPYLGNLGRLSQFAFEAIDASYPIRAVEFDARVGHIIVAGYNYGLGSSHEHAALVLRFLGLQIVLAKSFSRIHRDNLINVGVLPLTFVDPSDYDRVRNGDVLRLKAVRDQLRAGGVVSIDNVTRACTYAAKHALSARRAEVVIAGGLINCVKAAHPRGGLESVAPPPGSVRVPLPRPDEHVPDTVR